MVDRRRSVRLADESTALGCMNAVVASTRNIPRKGGVEFPRVLAQFLTFALDSGEFLELLDLHVHARFLSHSLHCIAAAQSRGVHLTA